MSKKSKRQIRKNTAQIAEDQTSLPAASSTPNRAVNFNPDYTYILKDLRRIGILAGSFVALLIVLALILPK